MNLTGFHTVIDNTPDEVRAYVKLSLDILERLNELLEEKFEGKQHLLAKKMGKSEAEVSKWLSGVQNFTTRTLAKLETAFGEPIVSACSGAHLHTTYVRVKTPFKKAEATVNVDINGALQEKLEYPVDKLKMHRSAREIPNQPA